MKVDKKLVEYLANLSRLEFDDTKLEEITAQLKGIVKYVEKLNTLDTGDVAPTAHILPLKNVFRKDEVTPSINRDKIFKSSPESDNGYFIVPRVIEE
ncbi:MAG: Asp-tRNA(Asn)/Glu-tRNA(Gln) amidotransferase subunit GatC [Candidatus Aureabacteria bacterium]|nr:Asp-tRNA(Asn)/Glu-tRNA(Gln) amidotransferase subunit GatC [Candidatus Auribacterota bacterium]